MKILIINAGSSSLKYQVIDMQNEISLGSGIAERIGSTNALLTQTVAGNKTTLTLSLPNHTAAFKAVIAAITDKDTGFLSSITEVAAIGHRVLHGAENYKNSVLINDTVMATCYENAVLGPLHQYANLGCIESCISVLPGVPNVAVFDTVFHSTMPQYAYMYAINYEDYEQYKIRRYGFHGTSHKYVSSEAVKYLNIPNSKIIVCHLGNGSSLAAVVDGKCVDTSMGLTPLEGMIMGTRSGDCDPAVVSYMAKRKNISADEVVDYLNKKSGFLGIAGVSDFRDLTAKAVEAGDERAVLAIDMFAYRIRKYIGSYFVAMNGLDCIVFTGGIGENAWYARQKITEGLECIGVEIDSVKNKNTRGQFGELHTSASKIKVVVIPTNEELMIARETQTIVLANK
ncbi:MAG: acetate kinase [Christensenellaceae bacterium]|jgi:acetate kinase|nr:acetate kinase [Christensenellaceae bacterium]